MIERIKEILNRKLKIMRESFELPPVTEMWKINNLLRMVDFLDAPGPGEDDELLDGRLQLLHKLLNVGDMLIDTEVRSFLEKEKMKTEKLMLERRPSAILPKKSLSHVRKLRIPK